MTTKTSRVPVAEEVSLTEKKENLSQDTQKLIEILKNDKLPYHEKLAILRNELDESVREINFSYQLSGFLEDSAYALHRAVQKVHGFTSMKNEKSASKDNPPEMIDVKFADGSRIKVPFGSIALSQFGQNAYIEMSYDQSSNIMYISGTCEKRWSILMDQIMDEAQHYLDTDSIYKNKAIKYDGYNSPVFINLNGIDKDKLFITETAKFATLPIEARIERTEECLANGIDLKFGVLLEGPYGTGKTLYANKLAKKAIDNGWTFIYCSKPQNTLQTLKIANKFTKNGKGVVLFVEDIDKVLNQRNKITNEISLLMDGSETKHNNIISIFSTNHIEKIDPTFLRGKRIGSLVTLGALDEVTAKEMLEHNLAGYNLEQLDDAAKMVAEYEIVPAFLAEIIDSVKTRAVLLQTNDVAESDIINAIKLYKRQMDAAKLKSAVESDEDAYMRLHKTILEAVVDSAIDNNDRIDNINDYVNS